MVVLLLRIFLFAFLNGKMLVLSAQKLVFVSNFKYRYYSMGRSSPRAVYNCNVNSEG